MKNFLLSFKLLKLELTVILFLFSLSTYSQTNKHPILISLSHINKSIKPLEKSALKVKFKIPRGYWLGSSDPSARNPATTLIEVEPLKHFRFGKPIYPKTVTVGVPVRKGNTHIFKGEISVIIPFTTDKDVKDGNYKIVVKMTYTPGLNAGQLITHINILLQLRSIKIPNFYKQRSPSLLQVK